MPTCFSRSPGGAPPRGEHPRRRGEGALRADLASRPGTDHGYRAEARRAGSAFGRHVRRPCALVPVDVLTADPDLDLSAGTSDAALRGFFRGTLKCAGETVVDVDHLIGAGDGEHPHYPWRSNDQPQFASGGGGLPAGDHDGPHARRVAECSRSHVDDQYRRPLAESRPSSIAAALDMSISSGIATTASRSCHCTGKRPDCTIYHPPERD